MLGDDLCAVSWRARPGSFVGLMTLYESNYIRLGWLVSDLRALTGTHVSQVSGDCDLRLTVLERGPYTTTLALTYEFKDGARPAEAPSLEVRVYHDARLAEVHRPAPAAADQPVRPAVPSRVRARRAPADARWTRNVMLNKWLEYCTERGHHFTPNGA